MLRKNPNQGTRTLFDSRIWRVPSDYSEDIMTGSFIHKYVTALRVLAGIFVAVCILSSAISATHATAAKKKKTKLAYNGYRNQADQLGYTVHDLDVKACQRLNVRLASVSSILRFAYPYGSIERQTVEAKVGTNLIRVRTVLRDINLDSDVDTDFRPDPFSQRTEFKYGCSYTTDNFTRVQISSRDGAFSASEDLRYQEDPRIFHWNRFVTKRFVSEFTLPKPLKSSDLARGNYLITTSQHSAARLRDWKPELVEEETDPVLVAANPVLKYRTKLKDPSVLPAVLAQGDTAPPPLIKTWKKVIRVGRQKTFRTPRRSPWTYKPKFRNKP